MTNRWIWWLALCVGCGGGSGAGNAAPTNTVLEPAIDVTVIVGDSITIRYRDDDPDDEAQTTVLVDRDGDLATTGDQIELAARIDGDGVDQEVDWNTTGVVRGFYRVFHRDPATFDGHVQRFTKQAYRGLLEGAGFEVLTVSDMGESYSWLHKHRLLQGALTRVTGALRRVHNDAFLYGWHAVARR